MNTPIKNLFALAEEAIAPVIWTEKKALQKFKEAATPEQLREVAKAFQTMEQEKKAAESKLAELEKQEPIGRVDRGSVSDSNEYPDARVVCLHEHVGWEAFQDGTELFLRPVPAIKSKDNGRKNEEK